MAKHVEDPTTGVQWSTPISQLIPGDFKLRDKSVGHQITVEDALSHRTGLPRHDHASSRTSVRENVRQIAHLPLTAELRTRYQYNNLMYVVASHVIETVTGDWLGDCLARSFWQPLGMTGTYFCLDHARAAPETLAQGYYYSGFREDLDDHDLIDDELYQKVNWMSVQEVSGAGAIITNVLDYAKWVHAWLHPQSFIDKNIFHEPETVRQLWEPRTLIPADKPFTGPRAYALGWETATYHGVQLYEHSGGMNAFGTQLLLVPELHFGVIIMANTPLTSNFAAQLLAYHLLNDRLNVPLEKRFDWDRKNWSTIEKEKQRVANKINYRPVAVLSPSLPLGEYTGTYSHDGYKSITVYLGRRGELLADRKDMTWPEAITFQPVSGEHFLMISEHDEDFGAFCPEVYEAEFRIDIEGKACALGIAWENAMGNEKIWFTRT